MICDAGSVVVVPYPFMDHPIRKVRPALVLSDRRFNAAGQTLTAMITTAARSSWPEDRMIKDWVSAGLRRPCVVRFKVFTLQNEAIDRMLGRLALGDADAVRESLKRLFALAA